MLQEQELNQVFSDLAAIRRAIQQAAEHQPSPLTKRAARSAHFIMQVLALAAALSLVVCELASNHLNTAMILVSSKVPELKGFGLANLGFALLTGCGFFYLVLVNFSRRAGQDYQSFIARNFAYLRNFSFLSDLLIKYIVVALLILFDRPALVAPMFSLFIADYLFQGRFFTLSFTPAMLLGLLCVGCTALQIYVGSPRLVYPLALFCLVSLFSIAALLRQSRGAAPAANTQESK